MKTSRLLTPLLGSIAFLFHPAHGAEIAKLQNTTALNLAGAWNGGVVPGVGDVMLWNNTYTTPGIVSSLSQLGGDLSVMGLRVTNVGGTRNAATTMVGIQNGSSANTLTIGAGGIDMATALQALRIQSRVLIGANQTWTVANANSAASPLGFNNGEDLGFDALAAGVPMNLGGSTVTTTGAGQITITSGFTMSNGTLNIGNNLLVFQGGANRANTLDSTVTANVNAGGTFRLQSNSGALLSNAPINLNGGTLELRVNAGTPLTLNGATNVLAASTIAVTSTNPPILAHNGNLTGSAPLTINFTGVATALPIQFAGDNSGYTGTLTLGGTAGRATRLNTATAGSAAATWAVSTGHTLQVAGVGVELGTLNGGGSVSSSGGAATVTVGSGAFSGTIIDGTGTMALTKTGSGTLSLSGLNTYTGATTVSGGTLLVSTDGLSGTAVSVASGATYAVQSAFPGTVNAAVTVDDGGSFSVLPLAAGVSVNVPSLTIGTATGGTINLNTSSFGNPSVAPLDATAFTPSAGTQLKITGSALTAQVGIPLISYTGTIGGAGFAGLNILLPARTTGNLVNNTVASRVDLDISSIEQVKWKGNVDSVWDIDPDGANVTGTPNWVTTVTNAATRYLQGSGGTDAVNFDDSATGTTNVNLSTTLTPGSVSVNNTTLNYTFSGTGKLSGNTSLTKTGTGTLALANSVAYDHSGGTTISAGTLQVGDGTTPGVGILPAGSIANEGTISLNRPDDFAVSATITGTGTLAKNNANTVNFSSATTLGNVAINTGTLRYDAGGTINGQLSGTAAGTLAVQAGTLQLTGSGDNIFDGTTTVSGGILQLNKIGGNAIGGTINFTNAGAVQFSQGNQIEDSATINYDKPVNGGNLVINETVGTINNLNGNDTGAQVIANNGFVVTGVLTAQNTSVFSVASNHSGTVGGLNVNGTAIIRIAANSNPSTLNVGATGIIASGGTIQVGQGTGAFDAVLNLDGDVVTTGNLAITNGGFTGAQLRQITLVNTHTFNIGAGTTTTVAPSIVGPGNDLLKTGGGTLTLNGPQDYATLDTSSGTTNLNNALGTGTSSIISNGATNISVSQTLASLDIGAGGVVTLGAAGPAPAPEFDGGFADIGLAENGAQAVPEPGAISLLALGLAGLLSRRSR